MESTSLPELLGPEAKKATGWLIALSIVMILTGIVAIAMPGISSVTFTLILGWLLLFNGIVRIVNSFRSKPIRGFWLSLIVGILYTISGVIVIANPIGAVLTLTWLFGFLLIFEGIVTIISAFVNKTWTQPRLALGVRRRHYPDSGDSGAQSMAPECDLAHWPLHRHQHPHEWAVAIGCGLIDPAGHQANLS
jgi:uncharacterized membrane protein HdeD (DUF308 family)